jgi:hypothetical protein
MYEDRLGYKVQAQSPVNLIRIHNYPEQQALLANFACVPLIDLFPAISEPQHKHFD